MHRMGASSIESGSCHQTCTTNAQPGRARNTHQQPRQPELPAWIAGWLQPSLHRTLRDLASDQVGDICIVPVSFVSDHVETLGEIDHEAREEAYRLGITQFEMSTGLNDSPKFISALGQLVFEALSETVQRRTPVDECGKQIAAAALMAAD